MNLSDHTSLLLHKYRAEDLAREAQQHADANEFAQHNVGQNVANGIGKAFVGIGNALVRYGNQPTPQHR